MHYLNGRIWCCAQQVSLRLICLCCFYIFIFQLTSSGQQETQKEVCSLIWKFGVQSTQFIPIEFDSARTKHWMKQKVGNRSKMLYRATDIPMQLWQWQHRSLRIVCYRMKWYISGWKIAIFTFSLVFSTTIVAAAVNRLLRSAKMSWSMSNSCKWKYDKFDYL